MPTLYYLFLSLRPRQWTKNLFVFAGLLFSQNLLDARLLALTTAAFAVFCLLSGAVYLLNDVVDAEHDRLHPLKSKRPIAAGLVGKPAALTTAVALAGVSLTTAFLLGAAFGWCAAGYLVLQALYSLVLKNIVILDLMSITAGFLLRVAAGTAVIDVAISSWLLLCATLLALFLALSKRHHELAAYQEQAVSQRRVLKEYSLPLLDQMTAIVTAATLISYALYTMAPETIEKFGTDKLIYSVPFVLFGIFRYLYLVHQRELGESPEMALVRDRYLLGDIVLWVGCVLIILYR
jgi:4-hydroxybenzoate polyprenyltransferase